MWTTYEKVLFSLVHCEVQKQPNSKILPLNFDL
jgi:hypothetical protein